MENQHIAKKVKIHQGARLFYTLDDGRRYSRIVAGVGFPGRLPGFAAVFGESHYKDHGLHDRHIDLLAEIEDARAGELLRRLTDAVDQFEIGDIFGFLSDQVRHYLNIFNRKAYGEGRLRIYVKSPPWVEDDRLESHLRILADRLAPERKSVHLLEGGRLQTYLMQLPAEDMPTARAKDWPAIAAAAFAVSALTVWPLDRINARPTHYDTDYDDDF